MRQYNRTTATRPEHGRVGSRILPVEHTETWVGRSVYEQAVRRPNDTNANGDRPTRETSGDRGRLTLNRGGILPPDSITTTTATEATKERGRQQ
jgi:hypothetical protein